MKKAFLSAIIIASSSALYAQPVLTAATNNPVIGDIFTGTVCDTTGVTVGAGGAALTWNYATLAAIGGDTSGYLACSPMFSCDSFPGTSFVYETNNGGGGFSYTYETASTTALQAIGSGLYPMLQHYSNPRDVMFYPAGYDSTHADTFASMQGDSTFTGFFSGTDSFVCDGYGTLTLPSGTFTNVLRIHITVIYKDSINVHVMGFDTVIVNTGKLEQYGWYQAGFHNPLLNIDIDTAGTGTPYVTDVEYFGYHPALAVYNVAANAVPLQVYPNPASSEVNLKFSLTDTKGAIITISDVYGRVVAVIGEDKMNVGANDLAFPVSGLANGIYMVRLQSAHEKATQKVIISK